MKPDVVFFDFGGTLARQTNTREQAIAASLAQLGRSIPAADVSRALATARERYAGRSPHGLTFPQRQELFIGMYEVVAQALDFGGDSRRIGEHLWQTQRDSYVLYPEVKAALQALKAGGARLGIISNWDKLNLADVCRGLGIADCFDVILPSAQAEADKPDPRIFRCALELAGVGAESAVHVGDSYDADVQGARGVGMIGVLVQRVGGPALDCPIVRGLDEVPEILV